MWKRFRSCCFYVCKNKHHHPVGPDIGPVGPVVGPVVPVVTPVEPAKQQNNEANQQKLTYLYGKYDIATDLDNLVLDDSLINDENALDESLKALKSFIEFKISQSNSCPSRFTDLPKQKAFIGKRKKSVIKIFS